MPKTRGNRVFVVGVGMTKFEKPGRRESPLGNHVKALAAIDEFAFPVAPWIFGAAGRKHMKKYGTTAEHFAKIGYKNHKHSVNNPYAQFQQEHTLDDILAAKMISDPLTKLQCSPTSDGSGAAIVVSEEYVADHDLAGQAVEIVGQSMTTDFASTFDGSAANIIGYDVNVQAAQKVYDQSGLARRTSRSSSCTTASRPTSFCSTRPLACAARVKPPS